MADAERIKYHPSLGKVADDFLETVYAQIYHQNGSEDDKRAFGVILDQYTKTMLETPIPFGDAAFDMAAARKWLHNFPGELNYWTVTDGELAAHPELAAHGCEFGAKIERGIMWAPAVYARTHHDVVLLAGVQVLREIAYETLNPLAGACKH